MIRLATPDDTEGYVRLRRDLWPWHPEEGHREDIAGLLALGHVLVAQEQGELVGFAEFSLRSYAEGCESSPVPFLEGWFVLPEWRNRGVGRALVEAFEEWARTRGFTEVASDVELENTASQAAHARLGFEEVERIVAFRKDLRRV